MQGGLEFRVGRVGYPILLGFCNGWGIFLYLYKHRLSGIKIPPLCKNRKG
jgi:hypothetical protein